MVSLSNHQKHHFCWHFSAFKFDDLNLPRMLSDSLQTSIFSPSSESVLDINSNPAASLMGD
jgi:hypothetical protein